MYVYKHIYTLRSFTCLYVVQIMYANICIYTNTYTYYYYAAPRALRFMVSR